MESPSSAPPALRPGPAATPNPLLTPWSTPFGLPPFDSVEDRHWRPAFERGLEEMRAKVAAIRENPSPPSFRNTIRALELASPTLDRFLNVFRNITSTDTDDRLQELQRELLPRLSRELDAIALDPELFARVRAVWEARDSLGLDRQDARLLELTHRGFVRSGAALGAEARARLLEINAELAERTTLFAQSLLAETKGFELVVEDRDRLGGLPPDLLASARRTAEARGRPEAWVFGLERSVFESFMTHAEDRELRRRLFDGYRGRGARGGKGDTRETLHRVACLRAERAALLGYASHADYQLAITMAGSAERVEELLGEVWPRALARAAEEKAEIEALAAEDGLEGRVQGWDWWFYAERLRRRECALDDEELRSFFELGRVRQGAFHVAERLFDLSFREVSGLALWHPSVAAFEVTGRGGEHLGLLLFDSFARESKKSGAWMNTYRDASEVDGRGVRPLVVNCMNLPEPPPGEPVLLRFEEVETLFHEFGHGLHGLLTRARYERFSGTSASPRDYVEFPSQLIEHFAAEPELLGCYARHVDSGEALPEERIEKLRRSRTYNQGFRTVEYVAASLLDMAWHRLSLEEAEGIDDVEAFERQVLRGYGLPEEIEPRYRSPYFAHIFSSPAGYAAGYYAYLWSEILEADGFEAFREAGDLFDPELAAKLEEHIFAAGYVAPGDELYRRFRGRDPGIEPLLANRGL